VSYADGKITSVKLLNLVVKLVSFLTSQITEKNTTFNTRSKFMGNMHIVKKPSQSNSLSCLGEFLGYDLYYSPTHPLKWKPFGLETCTGPYYFVLNFYQINRGWWDSNSWLLSHQGSDTMSRDRLVIKALMPCQRTISTQKLMLLDEVLGYDLYYSLTHISSICKTPKNSKMMVRGWLVIKAFKRSFVAKKWYGKTIN
jgi:hypothetical protein